MSAHLRPTSPICKDAQPASPSGLPRGRAGRDSRTLLAVLGLLALAAVGPLLAARAATAQTGSIQSRTGVERSQPRQATTPPKQERVDTMNPAKAVVLGLVEGVTEFLPVSSTGHLMVAERALHVGQTDADRDATDSYTVVIQFGAILAVAIIYWGRIASMLRGVVGRDREGRDLVVALIVAFIPAAVVGVLFEKPIKDHLFGAWPVVAAWIVGGAVILWFHRTGLDVPRRGQPLSWLTLRGALIIGVAQVLAMWPGTSRSLVTLLAGLAVGLSLPAAVEFTFLLGLATLGAATVYETAKNGSQLFDAFGVVDPLIGVVVAFLSAVVAVKWMVGYLQRHDLRIFGWYRIGIGVIVAALLGLGVL